jgi:hypothetical protein
MRARRQNRASPECPRDDNTLSEFRGPEPDRRLPSPAHPSAVLPTSLDTVQREACEISRLDPVAASVLTSAD